MLRGIGAFFALKDKKYEEALALASKGKDTYSVFLRAQIHLAKKDSKGAFELLASSLNEQLLCNDAFLIFLMRQCVNHKINQDVISQMMQ